MLIGSSFISIVYFSSIIFKQWIFDTEVKRTIADLPISKFLFWFFIFNFFLLGFIGARPIEEPYYLVGQCAAIYFFLYFFLLPFVMGIENLIIGGIMTNSSKTYM